MLFNSYSYTYCCFVTLYCASPSSDSRCYMIYGETESTLVQEYRSYVKRKKKSNNQTLTWIKIFCWNEAAHSRPRCLRVSLMCEFPFSTAPLNFNTQVRSSQLSRTVKVQELNLSFKLSQSQINPGSAAARSATFLLVTIENPLCYIQSEWAAISLSNLLFFYHEMKYEWMNVSF